MNGSLFRPEAIRERSDRIEGEILISTPIRWQIISYLMAATVALALIAAATIPYTGVVSVDGRISLDQGIVHINGEEGYTIGEIFVEDGQSVEEGQPLVQLSLVKSSSDGVRPQVFAANVEGLIEEQIERQIALIRATAGAKIEAQDQRIGGLKREYSSVERRRALQTQTLDILSEELQKIEQAASRGFVSKNDINRRRRESLSQMQALEQINGDLTRIASSLSEAREARTSLQRVMQVEISQLEQERLRRTQEDNDRALTQSFQIYAPTSGTVILGRQREGQAASPTDWLLAILPSNSTPTIELDVPPDVIGMITERQQVLVKLTTYRGTEAENLKAFVKNVPTVLSAPDINRTDAAASYKVIAVLKEDELEGILKKVRLYPGMTVRADVPQRRGTILSWLLRR
jgi:membrane fusion protein